MLPPSTLKFLAGIAAVLALSVACTREIGDSCTTGTDCSQTGGRTCDTTMPGGYCTVANCEPDSCPEEAACMGFVSAPSTADSCRSLNDSRELRQFCMRRCSSQNDCRGGYSCEDLNANDNAWGAKRLDNSSADGRVCALPYTAIAAVETARELPDTTVNTGYCSASAYVDNGYYAVGGNSGSGPNSSAGNAGSAGTAGSLGVAGGAGLSSSAGSAGDASVISTAGSPDDVGQPGNAGSSGGGTAGRDNASP